MTYWSRSKVQGYYFISSGCSAVLVSIQLISSKTFCCVCRVQNPAQVTLKNAGSLADRSHCCSADNAQLPFGNRKATFQYLLLHVDLNILVAFKSCDWNHSVMIIGWDEGIILHSVGDFRPITLTWKHRDPSGCQNIKSLLHGGASPLELHRERGLVSS